MRENLSSRLGKGECGCDDRCRRGAFLHWKLRICHWVSLTQLSPATSFLRHLLSCTCFNLASFAWHLIAVIFFFAPLAMDTALQLVQMYEANYPELLRRVYVINGELLTKLTHISRLICIRTLLNDWWSEWTKLQRRVSSPSPGTCSNHFCTNAPRIRSAFTEAIPPRGKRRSCRTSMPTNCPFSTAELWPIRTETPNVWPK